MRTKDACVNSAKSISVIRELGYFTDVTLYSSVVFGGSVAKWLACWTQAQKGLGSNRSRDAVG